MKQAQQQRRGRQAYIPIIVPFSGKTRRGYERWSRCPLEPVLGGIHDNKHRA